MERYEVSMTITAVFSTGVEFPAASQEAAIAEVKAMVADGRLTLYFDESWLNLPEGLDALCRDTQENGAVVITIVVKE